MKTIEATKWVGMAALIMGTTVRALNLSHELDLALTLVGAACWMVVGLVVRDKPLWAVNAFSVAILVYGLLGYVH
jgi:hypothetical protein